MPSNQFDSAYYRRFYDDPRTRVITRMEMSRHATAIAAQPKHLELPVQNILDAGCGLGLMRPALLRAFPKAKYLGLEVSEHLCKRFGWTRGSVHEHETRTRFDLIICNDVLQYLPDRDAARALAKLGRWCRGVLYLHVPTSEDWSHNADHSLSDNDVHLRTGQWYRSRLLRYFRPLGFGLYLRRNVEVFQWELAR